MMKEKLLCQDYLSYYHYTNLNMEDQTQISSVDKATEKSTQKTKSTYREFIDTALLILFVLIPIRLWVAQPFIVVGSSMYPTFHGGDYLVVDEISYRFKDPKRGDVIVFRPPVNPKDHFIKRIVGLPGETIEVTNNIVVIKNKEHPTGIILEEPYVSSERETSKSLTLGEDEYFVMGDNRKDSADSRIWGVLKKEKISGRALIRLFPFSDIEAFPGVHHEYKTY